MKSLLLILLVNFSSWNTDIDTIRNLYLSAHISEENCNNLQKKINNAQNKNPILIKGYEGCFYFIKCQFINNPFEKLKYFDKGKELLESAIKEDPQSVELKFLRYSIQKNLPKFLLYYENTEKDLIFVKNNINNIKDKKSQEFISKSLKAISK